MGPLGALSWRQMARAPEFRRKWWGIAQCTEPADRVRAEAAIVGVYRLASLDVPLVIWLPCPMSAAFSWMLCAAISNTAVAGRDVANLSLKRIVECATHATGYSGAVCAAMGAAIHAAVSCALRTGMQGQADRLITYSVIKAIGHASDDRIHAFANQSAKRQVRSALQADQLLSIDNAVRFAVAAHTKNAAGALHKSGMLEAAKEADDAFHPATYPLSSCAVADYFMQALGVRIDSSFLELASSCGQCWLLKDVCFASERPTAIHFDEQRRLHHGSGQSIGYRSGWGLWHWRGQPQRRMVIEQPELLPRGYIENEANVELRRHLIERYGVGRFLADAGAKLIHQDQRGKLWSCALENDELMVFVEVINRTMEPDGSFKHYFLRVPPSMNTASEAVAWTFGLEARNYRPGVET